MELSIWTGTKVRLRAPEPEDWESFNHWDQDSETARRSYEIPFPGSVLRSKQWAEEQAVAPPKNDAFRWVIENLDGQAVGTINTHTCDRKCGTFMYGLAVGREHWRQGYASEAILLVLRYYFWELGYQKVTAHVYSFNEPSISLHEKLGFIHEGRLRRMIYTKGQYYDLIALGMTREEFEAMYKDSYGF